MPNFTFEWTVPDAIQDEEQLYEDTSEREDASHQDAGDRFRVERLFGYLPRNLIGAHWVLDRLNQSHRRCHCC